MGSLLFPKGLTQDLVLNNKSLHVLIYKLMNVFVYSGQADLALMLAR